MKIGMYTHMNVDIQRFSSPFLCINTLQAMQNFSAMREMLSEIAKDKIDAEITAMDSQTYALYYIGEFDTETAKIKQDVFPEFICDESDVMEKIANWKEETHDI